MKAFKLLSLLFALLITQSAFSNTIYLEYDPACMDRYEYRYANSANGFSHIVYHIRLNDQQKVVLEVGIENRVNQRARPSDVKSCRDLAMNERFVRQVNKGDIQLYFVRRNGNEYNVSPVGLASYAQITPSLIGYSSIDHVFAYNFNQAANGKNIATKNSEAKVYYNGTVSYSCPKQYQFTKIRSRAGKNYTEMTLIPEIGVVEEKTGFNQTDAENNKLELISVNNVPLQQYLDGFCQGKELNYKSQGVFYSTRGASGNRNGNSIVDMESGNNNSNGNIPPAKVIPSRPPTTTTTTVPTTTKPTCNIYKDIDRGLYIDWSTGQPANGSCGGNTFRNGNMVNNSTPIVTTTTPPVTTVPTTPRPPVVVGPSTPVLVSNCPEMSSPGFHVVQRSETLYSIARLYGLSVNDLIGMNNVGNPNRISPCTKLRVRSAAATSVVDNTPSTQDWKYTDGTHIVSRGETIYQLAKKYGYSVDRFRIMNGLSASDPIYIGQRLKTSDCVCPAPGTVANTNSRVPAALPVPADFNATGGRINTKGDGTLSKRKVHIVKENETVYTIAKSYGISVARLRSLNKMEENEVIYPFQRLYIN